MDCLFLDTNDQFISQSPPQDVNLVAIEHKGWYVNIPISEIDAIKASGGSVKLLSPFSYLYFKHLENRAPHSLYILILRNAIYLVTFNTEDIPVYYQICDIDEDLNEVVKFFLHNFYSQKNTYFIERLFIYQLEPRPIDYKPIEEQLVLGEIKAFPLDDLQEYCQNEEYSRYFIKRKEALPESEPPFFVKSSFILTIGISVIVLLLGYYGYIVYENQKYEKRVQELIQEQIALGNSTNEEQTVFMKLNRARPFIEKAREKNALLTRKIKEIFDLIPDRTYLTRAMFDNGGIILEGVTLNPKEVREIVDTKLKESFPTGKLTFPKRTKEGVRFRAVYEELNDEGE
ncbi:MAG: hypothetical protein GXO61_00050 [Epsilonproteobacteria bacterium]|nr:hypothetical protein [Campylobacterota bacterium]